MAQTIKSVLLLDYDSVYASLDESAPGTGDLLGAKAGVWLEAIESGEIVEAAGVDSDARRRFQTKRCYADPQLLGKNRGWLSANGVQIIDCSVPAGVARGASDIHMVLDALDAVESEPDEIMLLTAETDLTPLLFRLRALNQRLIIYTTEETAVSYKTFADGYVDSTSLVRALSQASELSVVVPKGSIPRPPRMATASRVRPEPVARSVKAVPDAVRPVEARADMSAPGRHGVDRETLATLVRKIHHATNVPLFSPRAFADLFRLLAEEIGKKGYKFQSNTENVATGMNELGRNVSKRQIGLVVKGLALSGHIFSAEDTPEILANGFYEQVLFLVENAKLELTDSEKGLVQAWIVGFRSDEGAPPAAASARTSDKRSPSAEPKAVRPARPIREAPAQPRSPSPITASPLARQRPAAQVETGRRAAAEPNAPLRAALRPVRVSDAGQPAVETVARPAKQPRRVAAAPPRSRQRVARGSDSSMETELEDSILSAIADAVDILAEDGPTEEAAPARRAPRIAVDVEPPPLDPNDGLNDDAEADEIGDEIQRILATYSENR